MHKATQKTAPKNTKSSGCQDPNRIPPARASKHRDGLLNQQDQTPSQAKGQIGPSPRQNGVSVKEFSLNPGRKEAKHVSVWQ